MARLDVLPHGFGVAIEVHGLRKLLRDLRAIDRGLEREVRRRLRQAAEPVRATAEQLAPRSDRPLQKGRRRRLHESLRVYARGARVYIASPLPYATIVHWGGRRPTDARRREGWIAVEPDPFIEQAAFLHQNELADDVTDAVNDLARRNGFH